MLLRPGIENAQYREQLGRRWYHSDPPYATTLLHMSRTDMGHNVLPGGGVALLELARLMYSPTPALRDVRVVPLECPAEVCPITRHPGYAMCGTEVAYGAA
eukprot:2507222-Rhodomonas_salina.1